ncbi:MAG TPA: SIS domain-containing protein [archaeon]|nr:SIS domain-containing protein [archaeon]
MNKHLDGLIENFPLLESCRGDIERAFYALVDSFRKGGKILLCGNGGSAADCEHWSAELMKGFLKKRPLSEEWQKRLGEPLGSKLQGALPSVPLPALTSLTTAFANDVDPELAFAQCVWALGVPGDVLVALSTSGNSKNILQAVRVAKAKGLVTVGLTGQSGGKLAGLADICIKAPAKEVHRVQQYHLPIYHALCLMLEDKFFD